MPVGTGESFGSAIVRLSAHSFPSNSPDQSNVPCLSNEKSKLACLILRGGPNGLPLRTCGEHRGTNNPSKLACLLVPRAAWISPNVRALTEHRPRSNIRFDFACAGSEHKD